MDLAGGYAYKKSGNSHECPDRRCIFAFKNMGWVEMDSNHRRRKPADLQSAPFGHSGIHPIADAKLMIFFGSAKSKAVKNKN